MIALLPLIVQGLASLPAIIIALKTVFGTSAATSEQKAEAVSSVAGIVLSGVASVSKGGQAESIAKAQSVLPQFHVLMENLMALAESTGQPGELKQKYVAGSMESILSGFEQLSTGGQATTVAELKPVVQSAIDNFVPILFPKSTTPNIENTPIDTKG